MNVLDSRLVRDRLEREGFVFTEDVADADVALYNTCSVRRHAEEKVFSWIGHLKRRKQATGRPVIGVLGCTAQREGNDILKKWPQVDLVVGPQELWRLPDLLSAEDRSVSVSRRRRPSRPEALEALDTDRDVSGDLDAGKAYLRVMRGCDKFCSFCIVPYVRGRELARPPENILDEARRLADAGCVELTLLGQTVDSYRYAQGETTVRFADLLEKVHDATRIPRLRFVTSHPSDLDDSVLNAMAGLDRVCEYLHLPAQSGSDRILKAMRRGYTSGEYLGLLDRARDRVEGISLAGDFIIGFPGETESDFAATEDLLRRAGYKNSFIFDYSPRPGTFSAEKMSNDVPAEVIRRRHQQLLVAQEEVSLSVHQGMVGRTVSVLVEGVSPRSRSLQAEGSSVHPQLTARTRGDHIVCFNGPEKLIGTIHSVAIVDAAALTLFGDTTGSRG